MTCITRCILRWGLIGGLALGGVTLLIGPERVAAGFSQMRTKAQSMVDGKISDPVAIRRQLSKLSEEYPSRIAEVRGELAEIQHQISQYDRDMEIAQRVVAMTTDDLRQLKTLVQRAEAEHEAKARPVAIRFDGVRYNVEQALTEARRINNVRQTYRDRLAQDEQQLKFLQEQQSRLAAILEQLESEYSTFQAQLWQLDRQIDAIERNDRLIQLTEQQQATLQQYERYGTVGNLKQLEGKLAQLRAIQEAQLQTLESRGVHRDYEGRAKYDLDTRDVEQNNPFSDIEESSFKFDPETSVENKSESDDRSLAWSSPIIIE
jgi:chromosome segregation ATPase